MDFGQIRFDRWFINVGVSQEIKLPSFIVQVDSIRSQKMKIRNAQKVQKNSWQNVKQGISGTRLSNEEQNVDYWMWLLQI